MSINIYQYLPIYIHTQESISINIYIKIKLHELNIKLTKSQILKILNDEPFEITHEHIGHGRHVLHLKKLNFDKLMKGHKIKLSSDEKDHTIEGNGGFGKFFKSVGRTF
jgi:hypothetical protein